MRGGVCDSLCVVFRQIHSSWLESMARNSLDQHASRKESFFVLSCPFNWHHNQPMFLLVCFLISNPTSIFKPVSFQSIQNISWAHVNSFQNNPQTFCQSFSVTTNQNDQGTWATEAVRCQKFFLGGLKYFFSFRVDFIRIHITFHKMTLFLVIKPYDIVWQSETKKEIFL